MGKGAIRVLPRELYYEFVNMGSHIKRKYAHEDVGDTLENRLSKESIEALHKITEK
jgi:predicted RNA-binding protein with PIN domain